MTTNLDGSLPEAHLAGFGPRWRLPAARSSDWSPPARCRVGLLYENMAAILLYVWVVQTLVNMAHVIGLLVVHGQTPRQCGYPTW